MQNKTAILEEAEWLEKGKKRRNWKGKDPVPPPPGTTTEEAAKEANTSAATTSILKDASLTNFSQPVEKSKSEDLNSKSLGEKSTKKEGKNSTAKDGRGASTASSRSRGFGEPGCFNAF